MENKPKGFRLNERYAPDELIKLCNAAYLAGKAYNQVAGCTCSSRSEVAFGFLLGVAYTLSRGKELPF